MGKTECVLLQHVQVIQGFARSDRHTGDRIVGNPRFHTRHTRNQLIKPVEQAAAARHHDAVFQNVAQQLGIDEYKSGCLPETKVEFVENVKRSSRVAVVGDGVNDAPALAAGDLGIAMGAIGSDIAISSASIALMTNDLRRIAVLLFLSKKSQVIINQNLLFGMLFVFGGMILSIVGVMTPIWAAVLHAGSTLIIIFNSARLVRTGEELTMEENSTNTDSQDNTAKGDE